MHHRLWMAGEVSSFVFFLKIKFVQIPDCSLTECTESSVCCYTALLFLPRTPRPSYSSSCWRSQGSNEPIRRHALMQPLATAHERQCLCFFLSPPGHGNSSELSIRHHAAISLTSCPIILAMLWGSTPQGCAALCLFLTFENSL